MGLYEKSVQINGVGVTIHIAAKPPEHILAHAWLLLKQQDLLDTIWHVNPITISGLFEWAADPKNMIFTCLMQTAGSEEVKIVGLGWINTLTRVGDHQYKAEVGMGFLREGQVHNLPAEFCEMMLDWGFENLEMVVAYGTTPVKNHAAIAFTKKMGFETIGIAPDYSTWKGEPVDCLLTVMTHDRWVHRPANPKQVTATLDDFDCGGIEAMAEMEA